jgi:ketosteroid isomerase-like protein
MLKVFMPLGAAMLATTVAMAEPMNTIENCRKAADLWKAAYNSKDAEALSNMYDEQGTLSTPFWTATGRDALLANFKQELSARGSVISVVCDKSNQKDNLNYASGTFSGIAKGPDEKDIKIGGHWVAVSEIRNGKFIILMHNANMEMTP